MQKECVVHNAATILSESGERGRRIQNDRNILTGKNTENSGDKNIFATNVYK